MLRVSFFETFVEIYSAGAAFVLIFLIGQILFMMRKVDTDLLKARLFLNEAIMQKTWIYISTAGAAFALNAFVKFIIRFTTVGEVLHGFYLAELSQLIFLVAFILAVYNWYIFIGTFVSHKRA
ncbi:Uncharacterised protein [uncultured archaeon]|nr:Uncharacterised protein [uncultured archaeon]